MIVCEQYKRLFIILALIFKMIMSLDHVNESTTPFSGEFEKFLHGLGSMVYKYKHLARISESKHNSGHESQGSTITPTKIYRRNEVTANQITKTQKDALKDVLMMKLVSYYEDKYKIAHHETQDLLTITTSPMARNVENVDAIDKNDVDEYKLNSRTGQQYDNTKSSSNIAEVIVI